MNILKCFYEFLSDPVMLRFLTGGKCQPIKKTDVDRPGKCDVII